MSIMFNQNYIYIYIIVLEWRNYMNDLTMQITIIMILSYKFLNPLISSRKLRSELNYCKPRHF